MLVGDDIVGGSHPIKKPGLILGEDPVYTDSATVTSVQKQLYKLSVATSTPSLDPGTIDGKVGPHTNAAVAVFNTKYGWPTDGSKITRRHARRAQAAGRRRPGRLRGSAGGSRCSCGHDPGSGAGRRREVVGLGYA